MLFRSRTTKGKGFLPAEKDPATWHAPGIFDPATGERPQESPEKPPKYQDIFGSTLVEIADSHPEVVGITAAMPSGTSMNKLAEKYPERTFDVGISEGHAVTFSGGLAKDGLKPFVAIYSSFLQRAYSHIIHDVAIEGLPVTFCIDRAGLVGEDGPTHHGVFDLAYLRSIPGMTIAAPRNGDELRRLMHTSLTLAGPIAIRYPRGRAKNKLSGTIEHVTIGKGVRIKDGNDLAILTIGTVADDTTDAIKQAEHDTGKSIAHYDMRFVKPLDSDILTEVARKRCPVITIEDGTVNGGMGSAVLEWLADYFNSSEREETAMPRLIRMGVPDRFIPQGTPDQLHHLCGFDAEGIYKTIKSILK